MKLKTIPYLLAGTVLLSACQPAVNNSAAPSIQKADAAVIVNGQLVSKADLEILTQEITQRARGQKIPKEKLIDELIKRELLIQDAKLKNLDKSPKMALRLEGIKDSLLTQFAVEDYMQANPVNDIELKAEYDKQIQSAGGGIEFKARHILLKTEDEAKAVIAQLDKGADFAELAKTKSTGPSKTQGGDLGWFGPKQMVAPFSEAVAALADKSYTKTAVKTQFGWHIILREASRQQTPPAFEAIKSQLEPLVKRQKLTDYIERLRKTAKVEILVSTTDEAPAPATEKLAVEPQAN